MALNPFARAVGKSADRRSEQLVEVSVDGGTPIICAEVFNVNVDQVSRNFAINMLGVDGTPFEDEFGFAWRLTMQYHVGTDGSRWERWFYEKRQGIYHDFLLTTTNEDIRTVRRNGGSVYQYSDIILLSVNSYNNSDANSSDAKSGNIVMFAREQTPLRYYQPVQGVI